MKSSLAAIVSKLFKCFYRKALNEPDFDITRLKYNEYKSDYLI